MRHRHQLSAVVSLVVLVSGCGAAPGSQGPDSTITIGIGADPVSADPALLSSSPDLTIANTYVEGLTTVDQSGEVRPMLATGWTEVDPTTWRFDLRPGVTFHNGATFTSADVVHTFDRLLAEDNGLAAYGKLSTIEEVTAVDELTVELVTKAPDALLLKRLIWAQILPKDYLAEVGQEKYGLAPVGTGPYEFVSWTKGNSFVVRRYADYWGERPANDEVVFRIIPEDSTRASALATGEIDLGLTLGASVVPQLADNESLDVVSEPSVRSVLIAMDTTSGPLADVRVRRALNHAVDRESIIDNLLGGQAVETGTFFGNPLLNGYDESIADDRYTYDPDLAKRLLAEAGYPDGLTVSLDGPKGRYINDAEITEAIAGQLAKVGVTTDLTITEGGAYMAAYQAKQLNGLFFIGFGNPFLDLDYLFGIFATGTASQYVQDERFAELVRQERTELDPARRAAQLAALHEYVVTDLVPAIFLWDDVTLYARTTGLCGFEPRADEFVDVTVLAGC